MFLDQAKIFIRSGNGGSGAISFRREKYVPRGGPDGGDGGRGGHIIMEATHDLNTLIGFRHQQHFRAENGEPGGAANRYGKAGADLIIKVPVGTLVINTETGKIIADLTEPGSQAIILRGGRGGRGNTNFATSTRQTPQFAEKGEPGTELAIDLELKLLADVGLIGFPNAGKSSLLTKISAARPKVADYPFTTLEPNLGVVDHKNESFVAVDIPGLIEGAHEGVGLGDQFLKHIERTRLLIHLVDLSGLSGRDPYQDYLQINQELSLYNPELINKEQIVAANKIDLPEARKVWEKFQSQVTDRTVIPISAATGEGIDRLLDVVIQKLALLPKYKTAITENIEPEQFQVEKETEIVKEGQAYRVKNSNLEKRILRYDINNDYSLQSLQRLLKRWGINQALIEQGVKEGDSVRIGDFEFTFINDD
ncbi:MAG: GTPase ObgE [Bacteroidota bacterium]